MKNVIRIFCILGSLLMVIALYKSVKLEMFRSKATKTMATVVAYKTNEANRSSKLRYRPVVAFKDTNGEQHTYTSTQGADVPEFSLNDQVEVYYTNDKVLIAGRESWFGTGLFAGFGAILFLLALAAVMKKKFL